MSMSTFKPVPPEEQTEKKKKRPGYVCLVSNVSILFSSICSRHSGVVSCTVCDVDVPVTNNKPDHITVYYPYLACSGSQECLIEDCCPPHPYGTKCPCGHADTAHCITWRRCSIPASVIPGFHEGDELTPAIMMDNVSSISSVKARKSMFFIFLYVYSEHREKLLRYHSTLTHPTLVSPVSSQPIVTRLVIESGSTDIPSIFLGEPV